MENIIIKKVLFSASLIFCGITMCYSQKPNFLFIYTDDQLQDECNFRVEGQKNGIYRNYCPTIDSLWQNGIAFPEFYVTSSVCTPSRYSVLTGQYASRALTPEAKNDNIVCIKWNTKLKPIVPHVGKLLKDAGYYTGFIGKNHTYILDKTNYLKRKVKDNDNPNDPKVKKYLRNFQDTLISNLKNDYGYDYAGAIIQGNLVSLRIKALKYHNLEYKVKHALEFFDEAKSSGKPFYLHFATNLNHWPYAEGDAFKSDPRISPEGYLDKELDVMPDRKTINTRVVKAGKDTLTSNVTWLDDGIKTMLNKLVSLGMLENTVIFYFNDNGDHEGKGTIYEDGSRTFGFISGYGKKGVIYSNPVCNVDLLPTMLEMAGVPKNQWPEMDGNSLVEVLNDPTKIARETVYLEMGYARAIIKDGFKYVALRTPDWWVNDEDWRGIKDYKKWHANAEDDYFILGLKPVNLVERRAAMSYDGYLDPDQLYDLNSAKPYKYDRINIIENSKYADKIAELKKLLKKEVEALPGEFGEFTH